MKNEYIKNINFPILGFIPLFIFDLLFWTINYNWAIGISVLFGFIQTAYYLNRLHYFGALLSALSTTILLLSTWAIQLFDPSPWFPIALAWYIDILSLLALILLFARRRSILKQMKSLMYQTSDSNLRNFNERLYFLSRLFTGALICHFAFIALRLLTIDDASSLSREIHVNYASKYIFLSIATLIDWINIIWINRSLNNEEWIPIVESDGTLKGRMAKALAYVDGRKHRNPIVRIAFVYNDMLYLQPRPESSLFYTQLLDYPIGGYVPYHLTPEAYCNELLSKLPKEKYAKPRLLLHHNTDSDQYKRLNYLYVVRITDESLFNETLFDHSKGKLWTLSLIEANLRKKVFSDFFEDEFNFLLRTIFVASRKPTLISTSLQ